jgi:hypothetical protein
MLFLLMKIFQKTKFKIQKLSDLEVSITRSEEFFFLIPRFQLSIFVFQFVPKKYRRIKVLYFIHGL